MQSFISRAKNLRGREEGWNHEQSFVPFGMGLFVWKKRKAEAAVKTRQAQDGLLKRRSLPQKQISL
ncbi:hypothetical protein [Planococcus maritimus]|uniref:hypothetical protein n=1 Tax=Planococcus maritimus TaxID=192421 RepID=UPI00079CCEF4|nr:hypothetical protein [Planococcus maritimus]KYG58147.1 hypothetical protein AY633_11080 [Planococcus maritimus]OED32104.1 hypothetical protein BHE17_06480 [Planococcus maritimus]